MMCNTDRNLTNDGQTNLQYSQPDADIGILKALTQGKPTSTDTNWGILRALTQGKPTSTDTNVGNLRALTGDLGNLKALTRTGVT